MMGQNNDAELSEAHLESRKAGRLTGYAVCDQRLDNAAASIIQRFLLPSESQVYLTVREDKGSAMAQMPTRTSLLSCVQTVVDEEKKEAKQ